MVGDYVITPLEIYVGLGITSGLWEFLAFPPRLGFSCLAPSRT